MERGPFKFEHLQAKSEDKKNKGELTISMPWVEVCCYRNRESQMTLFTVQLTKKCCQYFFQNYCQSVLKKNIKNRTWQPFAQNYPVINRRIRAIKTREDKISFYSCCFCHIHTKLYCKLLNVRGHHERSAYIYSIKMNRNISI